jgi:hypothetical protein
LLLLLLGINPVHFRREKRDHFRHLSGRTPFEGGMGGAACRIAHPQLSAMYAVLQ